MPEQRKTQPPVMPTPKVKGLATIIGQSIDAYTGRLPCTHMEVLQALEWVRYNVTEAVIKTIPIPKTPEA